MFKKKVALIKLVSLMMAVMILITGCGSNDKVDEGASSDVPPTKGSETETTLRIANYYAVDHPVNVALEEIFKEDVEGKTNGNLKVEIYPNNQLGDEQEFVEGVQIGTVEMAMTGNLWENTVPEFRIMQMPYMFVNYEHADAVLNGPIGEEIYKYIEPLNVNILASFPNGFRVVSNNARPINTLDDAKGIKLRVFEGETIIKLMEELGFTPVVMSISEIFTSLQQGVIDGQDNPLATSYFSGFYDAQKHVAITNHMYSPGYIVVNNDVWDKLTDEEQQIVGEAAQKAAKKIKEDTEKQDEDIIESITEKGVEVTQPELKPFMEKVTPIIDEYIEDYPHTEKIIRQIQELAEQYL